MNLINTCTDVVRKINAIFSSPFYCELTSLVWKTVTSVCRIWLRVNIYCRTMWKINTNLHLTVGWSVQVFRRVKAGDLISEPFLNNMVNEFHYRGATIQNFHYKFPTSLQIHHFFVFKEQSVLFREVIFFYENCMELLNALWAKVRFV